MISPLLKRHLEDLENRLDPEQEIGLRQSWMDFSNGNHPDAFFDPQRPQKSAPSISWESVTINAALNNFDLMAIQQYGACSSILEKGSGEILNVRCNYGTGIMPSLFGLEIFIMDVETNTLPTTRPTQGLEDVIKLLDQGIPDLKRGYGARVFEMGERYAEIGAQFPKISEFVNVYHPDLQGPLDICELIFGSSLFLALYDRPEIVKALLELVCETYIHFLKTWMAIHPFHKNGNCHWGFFHKGNIMLRDDSAMNLSSAMVREFALPYDQYLLNVFQGGAIHFCGKGDHYIQDLSVLEGVYAVNLSQPEYNDMEVIFQNTVDKGIALLGLQKSVAKEALRNGRDLRHLVHVLP